MKIMTKLAISLIILGCLTMGAALAMTGGDFSRLSLAGPIETKHHQADAAGLTTIEVDAAIADVEVIGSDRSDIQVDYTEDRVVHYTVSQDGGRLRIIKEGFGLWGFLRMGAFGWTQTHKVTLTVPRQLATELTLKSSTGHLSLRDLTLSQPVTVSGNTGDILLERVESSQDIKAKQNTGHIRLTQVTAQDLDADTATGDINLNQVSARNLEARVSTGHIKTKETQASGQTFKAHTATGDIEIDGLNAVPEISLITTTGNIKGRIQAKRSDYHLYLKGMERTTEENTDIKDRSLTAKTTTGDVNVEFSE